MTQIVSNILEELYDQVITTKFKLDQAKTEHELAVKKLVQTERNLAENIISLR